MVLFDNLKEGFENSLKKEVVDINPVEKPQRMVIITDGFDDIEERVNNAESICKSLNMELSKLYLHDFTHLMKGDEQEKASIVQTITDHSSIIRSLKDQSYIILLEETVKGLLVESRQLRQSKEGQFYELDLADMEAVAEYLLNVDERKQNFLEPIIKHINRIKPQIVSWKPPALETRGKEDIDPIRFFSTSLMRKLPKGTWVLFDGKTGISHAENIVCVVLGGQNEKEITDLAKSVPGIIPKLTNLRLTFLVVIKANEIQLAKMAMDQKKIEKVDEEDEGEGVTSADNLDPDPDTDPSDNDHIDELLTKRYKSLIDPLRIEHQGVDFQILIGDHHDLEVKLRHLKTDMILLANKESGGQHFDEEIVSISRSMVKNNITTLII